MYTCVAGTTSLVSTRKKGCFLFVQLLIVCHIKSLIHACGLRLYLFVVEKLQAFLQLLEEQSTPWKWKVHCKTQKKLKELSR